MTKFKSPQLQYLESNLNIIEVIQSYFPEYEEDGSVVCPFHEDDQPSLHIAPDGRAKCFGCGFKTPHLIGLVRRLEDMTDHEASVFLTKMIPCVPESKIRACEKALARNQDAMDYLKSPERNLSGALIHKYRLGLELSSERITIPIIDSSGKCRNLRRYDWQGRSDQKMINVEGLGETRIYPESVLFKNRRVLLVEGEFDAEVGNSFDIPTVSWTGGADSWGERYQYLFQDKAVWIMYDDDEAGQLAASRARVKLMNIAYRVMSPKLKVLTDKPQPKDLTEWSVACPMMLHELKEEISKFKFPKKLVRKNYCPTCGQEVKK